MKKWMLIDSDKNVLEFDPTEYYDEQLKVLITKNIHNVKKHDKMYKMDETIHKILRENKQKNKIQ